MTELEIIEYLKQNKEKGTAFIFMPQEVRRWCDDHRLDKQIFMRYIGAWIVLTYVDSFDARDVYALSEDYEQKAQFEPHWEEFEINKDGMFLIDEDTEKGIFYAHMYWFEWERFLSQNPRYNNFGGWLYVDSEKKPTWYTSPRIDVGGLDFTYAPIDVESKPAYPTKIRFWRYAE